MSNTTPIIQNGNLKNTNVNNSLISISASRSLIDKLSDIVSVKDYGANADSDLGAIINLMITNGIKNIYIPNGNWNINTTINVNVNNIMIEGAGHGTILSSTNSSSPLLELNAVSDIIISNITLSTSVDRNVPLMYNTNTFRCFFNNFMCLEGSGKDYGAVTLDGCNDTHFTDCEFHSSSGIGNGLFLTGTSQRCEDTFISNMNIVGYNVGIYLDWSSGNYFSNMDILSNNSQGILFQPASNHEVDGTRCVNILSDGNTSNGWEFSGSGTITETSLCGCWGSTNGDSGANSDGLYISNGNVNGLTIIGFEAHSNTANGIAIENGSNINISGSTIFHNGLNATTNTQYQGIMIDTLASFVVVSNNVIGRGGINAGQVPKETYGINIQSVNHIIVTNNIINQVLNDLVYQSTTVNTVINTNNIGLIYTS